MDLAYLFRVLNKRKWLILGAGLIAAAVAYYLTRNEPKTYLASTRISTGFAVPDEIKVNENFTLFDADVKFNNAISTMNSQSVISLLSYDLILHDFHSPTPFRPLSKETIESPFYQSINRKEAETVFTEKLDSMTLLTSFKPDEKKLLELLNIHGYGYKSLIQNINIYQIPRTDYIQIDSKSENPELSAFLSNGIYRQFIRYYRSIKSTKSQESLDTLKSIMDKKKQELDEKNKILRGEGLTDANSENISKFELIGEMEKSLTIEKNKQTDDYYKLRKINQKLASIGSPSTEKIQNSGVNNEELIAARKAMNDTYNEYLKTNDKSLLNKYNQLKTEYNDKYSASLNKTENNVVLPDNRKELLEQKSDIEIDIQASDEKIKAIENKISLLKSNVTSASLKGANIESLIDEVKLTEREYFEAKKKYNDALDMSFSSVNNFKQILIAQPAIEPEPSKRKMIAGLAGIITLLTTAIIITLLTFLDSSIKTPLGFSKTVNLKMISMVNFMNMIHNNMRDIITAKNIPESDKEKKRNNVFRESIRKLRYEIEASGHKTILFTSTKKGQGKTTLILALSYSMSMSNKKILIIDTNFCNPDLTAQLEGYPVLETTSAEGSNVAIANIIKDISKDIGIGNVFIIGSSGGDYTPSEILPTQNILNHLDSLKNEYDYIFLEGPPLNDFSDSKELITFVDGVVGIFSATEVIKQIDKESIQFFKQLDKKFIGSVLNKVQMEHVNVI